MTINSRSLSAQGGNDAIANRVDVPPSENNLVPLIDQPRSPNYSIMARL
jgi:hypothetical protein